MSGTTPALLAHALWHRRDALLQEAWARDPERARVRLHEWFRTDGLPPPPVPPFIAWVWARHAAAAQRWWAVYRQELARREAEIAALEQAMAGGPTCEGALQARWAWDEALTEVRRAATVAQAAVLAAPPMADEVLPTGELVCACCPQHTPLKWRSHIVCPGLAVCPDCLVERGRL